MAQTSNDADEKKVFDVAKPGKSTPDVTSRPVIIGHGPILQDPMVNGTKTNVEEDNQEDTAQKAKVIREKVLAPTDEATNNVQAAKSEDAKVQDTEDPKQAEKQSAEKYDSSVSDSNTAIVDAVLDQVPDKEQDLSVDNKANEQLKAIEKLIVEKKYYVPIGKVRRRKNTRRLLVTTIMLLVIGIIGGYVAIDAGFIKSDIQLPVHILHTTKS
ncbi:MAG: hypothetical protein NVSMB46_04350 [Candidatus Saccharimonadales bacterium]